jgi:hypothetical protein
VIANASLHSEASRRSPTSRSFSAMQVADGDGRTSKQPSTFPAWLLLSGVLLIPASLAVHPLGGEGFKFTPGRLAITLLLVPALLKLLRERRHFVSSDLFIFLAAAWMIGSRVQDDGLNPSAVAEVIELFGGYLVSRAYFFGRPELQQFMRVFKIIMLIIVLLATLEPLAGTNVVTTTLSAIFHTPVNTTQFRLGIARAQSTIEDSELFGTLCCVAGCLCLYLEPDGARKIRWVALCFFGCLLSISSGPLLAFAVVLASRAYDRLLRRFRWRWKAYVATITISLIAVFVISNNPVGWLIAHLLFDPGSSYFRVYVFDYYLAHIAVHPITGWGFGPVGTDDFLSTTTVDSVWIVCAVRYGIPMIFFLFLTNVSAFVRAAPRRKKERDPYIDNAGTAFTFGLVCLMLIGLTVHYWNAIWIFWGICLGTRASIKEFAGSTHYGFQSSLGGGKFRKTTVAGT